MDISKISLAYFSPGQSCKKIVQNVAGSISVSAAATHINLTETKNRMRQYNFASDELLIVAFPAYGGRVPLSDPEPLVWLCGNNTPAVIIAVYGGVNYGDALLEAKDILKDNGFVCIAAGAFVAEHAIARSVEQGRPDSEDFAELKAFGARVAEKLAGLTNIGMSGGIDVPGSEPYEFQKRKAPFSATANEKCIRCNLCVHWCPQEAIPMHKPEHTDPQKCMLCHGCINRCPVEAREVTAPAFIEKAEATKASWSKNRRPNETYM